MFGIKVAIIEPGLVATPFLEKQAAALLAVEHPQAYRAVVGYDAGYRRLNSIEQIFA